jgi:hypothetical protein
MKLWEVTMKVNVVTTDDETGEDAKTKLQPYLDQMGVAGAAITDAVELPLDYQTRRTQ